MKALLVAFLLGVALCHAFDQNYPLSGYVGDDLFTAYGGPQSMTFDASGNLWVLYTNVTTGVSATATGILLHYVTQAGGRSAPEFPINTAGSPVQQISWATDDQITLPQYILNNTFGVYGVTFNSANNFVLVGARPDSDNDVGSLNGMETNCEGVSWTINDQGEFILGPIEYVLPLDCNITGVAYVPSSDSYFLTEPTSAALYESIITCCREIPPPTPPESRWLQQLTLRRGVGLQYGLFGLNNIFARGVGPTQQFSNIAVPGFSSPQDVSYDYDTHHLWVVNNFPTTTVLEMTTDFVVLNHYNLESVTGGLRDASSIAVSKDYIVVGFYTEGYIAVFDKPSAGSTERELTPARHRTLDELKALEEKANVEVLQAKVQKNKIEKAQTAQTHKGGRKSHFH